MPTNTGYDAVIVGAGFAGLCMLHKHAKWIAECIERLGDTAEAAARGYDGLVPSAVIA